MNDSSKDNQSPSESKSSGFDVSTSLLERLADTMKGAELTEIEVVDGARSIRLTRTPAQMVSMPAVAASAPMAMPAAMPAPAPAAMPTVAAPSTSGAQAASGNAVKSPMVGTAYMSPEPGKPAFVAVGDKVSKGQTLMIIEAMKVMNPLPCPADGVIKDILVADGEPIEFDQPVVVLA